MCLCCVCRLRTFTVMHRWSVGFIVNGALQSSWLWLWFRDKRRFQSKVANFPCSRVFCAPAEGVPLELGTDTRYNATMHQRDRRTDRQTDGRTDTGRQQRLCLCGNKKVYYYKQVARQHWRCKNVPIRHPIFPVVHGRPCSEKFPLTQFDDHADFGCSM